MILVTGTSGQLGGTILSLLSRDDPQHVTSSSSIPGAAARHIDFDAPDTIRLDGVDTLILVSAGYSEDDVVVRRHSDVIKAAVRDGVSHVVYTSVVGNGGEHLTFALAHRATERILIGSGLPWTILRNGLYPDLIGSLLGWNGPDLVSPFGDGRVAAASREDLAAVAATVASAPGEHAGRIYELTGPAFAVSDVAAHLGVGVQPLTLEQFRLGVTNQPGLLPYQPAMAVSIASSMRHGLLAVEAPDMAKLLGRPPVDGVAAAARVASEARKLEQ